MTTRRSLAQNHTVKTGTLLEDFDALSEFTKIGTGTATEDTTYLKEGSKSLRFAAAAGGDSVTYDKVVSWDLSNPERLGVWFYIETHYASYAQGPQIYLTSDNFTNYAFISCKGIHQGWNFFQFNRSDMQIFGAGSIDWSAITKIRVSVAAIAQIATTVYIDSLFIGAYSKPRVIVSFDDGLDDSYTEGHVYANASGIPLTHFLIHSLLDNAGHLTSAQVQTMYDAGDDICLHDNERWDTQSDIAGRVAEQKALLDGEGWNRSTHLASYPGGHYGYENHNYSAVANGMTSAGIKSAATIFTSKTGDIPQGIVRGVPNLLTVSRYSLASTESLQNAYDHLDGCIARGQTCFFLLHKLEGAAGALTWAIADYQSLIDRIELRKKQGLVDPVTYSDWYSGVIGKRQV